MSSNSKLELKITTDSNGREIDLSNLSIVAAKSLNQILDSLIKIVEATPEGNDLRIKVVRGSATVIAEGVDSIINRIETDFLAVADNKSVNKDIVHNWRNIQSLISRNGLNYEVNFYSRDVKKPILNKIKNTKVFKVKVQRRPKEFELVFLKGKLIVNGGHKANLHLSASGEDRIIECSRETAIELNKLLYSDIYLSAWKRRSDDKKSKLDFCDSYLSPEIFSEYETFINSMSDLNESEEYVAIHDKIRDYISNEEFGKIAKIMRLYNHSSSDIGSLKTILLITKHFKENEKIKSLRSELSKTFESKLKKTPPSRT
jgi:uncharacterized protein YlzI (FlbEa/FlbD family)